MMKRFAMIFALALFAIASCAFAQDNPPPSGQDNNSSQGQPREHRGGAWGPRDPAEMVKHMTQDLNLTSDQQSKILTILQDQQKQMQALRDDQNTAPEDKRAKFMDLRKNTNTQIRAVLNEDQQKKFDEMQQKREQEMRQRQGNPPPGDQPKSNDQPK